MKRRRRAYTLRPLAFLVGVIGLGLCCSFAEALGGEKAAFHIDQTMESNPFWNNTQTVPRQDVCGRYAQVLEGRLTMREALRGLELRPLLRVGKFFRYNEQDGIDENDPGIMALLLDELGRRAGFTWRDSFGVTYGPAPNTTFSDLLVWSVHHYDVSVNWWDETLERLERGVSFVRPWFDGSLILIEKQDDPDVESDSITFANWLRPFTPNVWWMTIFTIISSGATYQWIEYLADEKYKKRRTVWQGFCDGVYLSAINFPQNYEFQPTTAAGRIFGISVSIWALVMTATYTANLASLLVDREPPRTTIASMEDVIGRNVPVCTYANTGMDQLIQRRYRSVKRVPLESELATYDALHEGRCDLTVSYYQNWLGFSRNRTFNPDCDLAWVGRTIKTIQSGFAVSADVGFLCSSLIRDVFNIYLDELINSGFLEDLWEAEYAKSQDINCDETESDAFDNQPDVADEAARRRRRLERLSSSTLLDWLQDDSSLRTLNILDKDENRRLRRAASRRRLRAGSRGAAAVGGAEGGGGEDERLTLNQMAGTFLLHYGCSVVAILVGYLARYRMRSAKLVKQSFSAVSQRLKRTSSIEISGRTAHTMKDQTEDCGEMTDSQSDRRQPASTEESRVVFADDTVVAGTQRSTVGDWQRTQQELHDMRTRMDLVVSMLTEMQQRQDKKDS